MNQLKKKILLLRENTGLMKYLTNTSWLFLERVLRITVGLFVGIWIARYLGPEQFGLLSYAQSFVGLFTAISTLGLDGVVIRELIKNEERRDELIGTAFILKGIGAFFVLFIVSIGAMLISENETTTMLIVVIASGLIFNSFNVIDFYFQAKVLSRYIVFVNTVGLFLSSLVKITLILIEAPLICFAWVVLFDSLVLALGYIYVYTKKALLSKTTLKFSKSTARCLLKCSWSLMLSGIVISIYMKIDQVMIMKMMGSEAVGQYSAAIKISGAWYFIPMIVSSSLFPAIINAKNISEKLYYARLQKLFNFMVWISLIIILAMSFVSDQLTVFLYGAEYHQAGEILMIHIWSNLFVFLGVVSSKWFIAENLQRFAFYRNIAGAIVNILLNYFLIPIYGIHGAACATIFSQMVASYLFNMMNKEVMVLFKMQTNALLFPFRRLGMKHE